MKIARCDDGYAIVQPSRGKQLFNVLIFSFIDSSAQLGSTVQGALHKSTF
jgi:hypothetical protein